MTQNQLDLCPNFDKKEIEATGAKIADIDFSAFMVLQNFRIAINRSLYFQEDGITSGIHDSKQHPEGKAFDIYFNDKNGKVTYEVIKQYFYIALRVGFRRIGIYYNGVMYSMHLDIGPEYGFWIAAKGKKIKSWVYNSFLTDPKKITGV
jgi:hypothetical protein